MRRLRTERPWPETRRVAPLYGHVSDVGVGGGEQHCAELIVRERAILVAIEVFDRLLGLFQGCYGLGQSILLNEFQQRSGVDLLFRLSCDVVRGR